MRCRLMVVTILLCSILLVMSCSKNDTDPITPPMASVPISAPASNDTLITVLGLRKWYFTRSPITNKFSSIDFVMYKQRDSRDVDIWIDSIYAGRQRWQGDSLFVSIIPPDSLAAGLHRLIISEAGDDTGFYASRFSFSEPYCITVSNDWDSPGSGALFDSNLTLGNRLHQLHPHLRMTHFVGPYAFTDTTISAARKAWLSSWLITARDSAGDEIGLHIHPYCCFINVAQVSCKTDSAYRGGTDPTGYRIALDRYTEEEAFRMFKCADSVFLAWGLAKPVAFRAGGWTAALHTLKALQRAAYNVDASGCNLSRGEELIGYPLGDWVAQNWPNVSDTSQPYYPSLSTINSDEKPSLSILEAPDNGILADYIDSVQMVEVFHKIWPSGPLSRAKHLSIGYHPDSFNWYFSKLNGALTYIDGFLAENDSGPVFYVRMSDLPHIWM